MRAADVVVRLRERVYDGYCKLDRIRLRHPLFSGGLCAEIDREIVRRGDAVSVLPYDPVTDQVVLIRQFRTAALEAGMADPWLWEIPAGIVEAGESPEDVARRELLEEAGCTATALERVCEYMTSPGVLTERIVHFHATVDASRVGGVHGLADEGEDIAVYPTPFREIPSMLADGRAANGILVIALQWLVMNRTRLRALAGMQDDRL